MAGWGTFTARCAGTVAVYALTAGCAAQPAAAPPATRHAAASQSVTPGIRRHVTGTYPPIGSCHTRTAAGGAALPDPACTPGDTDPQVTQATITTTICVRGWTATVRPPEPETAAAKARLMRSYAVTAGNELDHLIPLELGGASTVRNLWPEVGATPNAKDNTESTLRAMVCVHGRHLPLAAAQHDIAADWTTAVATARTQLVT